MADWPPEATVGRKPPRSSMFAPCCPGRSGLTGHGMPCPLEGGGEPGPGALWALQVQGLSPRLAIPETGGLAEKSAPGGDGAEPSGWESCTQLCCLRGSPGLRGSSFPHQRAGSGLLGSEVLPELGVPVPGDPHTWERSLGSRRAKPDAQSAWGLGRPADLPHVLTGHWSLLSHSLRRPPARPSLLSAAGEHRLGLREVSARTAWGSWATPCCRMAPGFPPSLLPLGSGCVPLSREQAQAP